MSPFEKLPLNARTIPIVFSSFEFL